MPAQIAIVNLKGGVGKTALAVNLAAFCGREKKKTLLVDLDPQTNATFSCITVGSWQEHARDKGTVADLLGARDHASAEGAQRGPADVLIRNVFPGVDLLPSHLDLFTVDLDLGGATARETRLRRSLAGIVDQYEMVICDCPPNLTIPTQNALALCSHYVVPISPDFLSSLGVALLKKRVESFCADLERDIKLAGIVISRVGRPATHRTKTVTTLKQEFGALVLDNQLKERVAVSEVTQSQKSIFDGGDALAAQEFTGVAREILDRVETQGDS